MLTKLDYILKIADNFNLVRLDLLIVGRNGEFLPISEKK